MSPPKYANQMLTATVVVRGVYSMMVMLTSSIIWTKINIQAAMSAGAPCPRAEVGASAGESRYDSRAKPILSQRLDREETRMDVLIGVIITFLVVILVLYLVNMLPIDGRAKQIVRVIVIILGVISLLKYLAVLPF